MRGGASGCAELVRQERRCPPPSVRRFGVVSSLKHSCVPLSSKHFMFLCFTSRGCFRHPPIASRFIAQLINAILLQIAFACALLTSAAFASPDLSDAENAIASLAHPHGAQYSFRISSATVAEPVDGFHHIPVYCSRRDHLFSKAVSRCTWVRAPTLAECLSTPSLPNQRHLRSPLPPLRYLTPNQKLWRLCARSRAAALGLNSGIGLTKFA
jgi:hypothetical protein